MDAPIQDFQIPISFSSLGLNMGRDKGRELEGRRERAEILTFGWPCSKQNQAGYWGSHSDDYKEYRLLWCTPWSLSEFHRHLGETCFVNLQNRRASQARNKRKHNLSSWYVLPTFSGSESKWSKKRERAGLLLVGFLLGFLFDPDDGSSTFRRNVGTLLLKYTTLHPIRH